MVFGDRDILNLLIKRPWFVIPLVLFVTSIEPGVIGRYTIVLDPGHGGEDKGSIGPGGLVEKDITLDIAKRLKHKLEAGSFEVEVLLTRTSDYSVSIRDRVGFANFRDASLFITLHTNGGPTQSSKGFEIWYDEDSHEESEMLGTLISKNLGGILHDRGTRKGRLLLRGLKMPSLLLEIGFITNPLEEARLKDDSFKDRISSAICEAILMYLEVKRDEG